MVYGYPDGSNGAGLARSISGGALVAEALRSMGDASTPTDWTDDRGSVKRLLPSDAAGGQVFCDICGSRI